MSEPTLSAAHKVYNIAHWSDGYIDDGLKRQPGQRWHGDGGQQLQWPQPDQPVMQRHRDHERLKGAEPKKGQKQNGPIARKGMAQG